MFFADAEFSEAYAVQATNKFKIEDVDKGNFIAVYPRISLFNHSCDPTAVIVPADKDHSASSPSKVITTRAVKAGQVSVTITQIIFFCPTVQTNCCACVINPRCYCCLGSAVKPF